MIPDLCQLIGFGIFDLKFEITKLLVRACGLERYEPMAVQRVKRNTSRVNPTRAKTRGIGSPIYSIHPRDKSRGFCGAG